MANFDDGAGPGPPKPAPKPIQRGYAPVKEEFIDYNHTRKLNTDYMPESVAGEMRAALGNKRSAEENDEVDPPKKKGAKLRGKTRHRAMFKLPIGDKICPQVVRNVACPWGDNCRFSHDINKYLESKPPDLGGPCYVFDTYGACPYSFTCRYAGNHTNDDGTNVIDEERMLEWVEKATEKNILSMDLQHSLRKKLYDFSKADDTWSKVAQALNVEPTFRGPGPAGRGNQGSRGYGNQGSGNGNQGSGYGNQGSGYGNQGPGYGNQGSGYGNQGSGYGNQDSGCGYENPGSSSGYDNTGGSGYGQGFTSSSQGRGFGDNQPGVPYGNPRAGNVSFAGSYKTQSGQGARSNNSDSGQGASSSYTSEAEGIFEKMLGGHKGSVAVDADLIRIRPEEKKEVDFSNKLYLAPLTTVGNLPFRRVCKSLGADITCGEMAFSTNLLQGQSSEWALLKRHASEDLFGVQICGSYPDTMTRCAQLLTENCDVDFIDINCGCPIDIVYKKGQGCALMGRAAKLEQVVKSMTCILDIPLTLKMRTGIYEKPSTAHDLVPKLREWGLSALTIHGRSREQRYTKLADWTYLQRCASLASPMPFFGNGDVLSYEDYRRYESIPGLTGIMIARGALIKPWLFTEIKENEHWDISANERLDIFKQFVNYGLEHWGSDDKGISTTRRFLLEWLSFTHRYIPVGILEYLPQKINEKPPKYFGRSDLETLLSSSNYTDWIKISEMLLGPVPEGFTFVPKHKANAYQ